MNFPETCGSFLEENKFHDFPGPCKGAEAVLAITGDAAASATSVSSAVALRERRAWYSAELTCGESVGPKDFHLGKSLQYT